MTLPEVQEILERLSKYNLGIFMPHMHDETTGEFRSLPEDTVQVESGLEVSFRPLQETLSDQDKCFVPVGWFWRAGAATPLAMCNMVCIINPADRLHYRKHSGSKEDAA